MERVSSPQPTRGSDVSPPSVGGAPAGNAFLAYFEFVF